MFIACKSFISINQTKEERELFSIAAKKYHWPIKKFPENN